MFRATAVELIYDSDGALYPTAEPPSYEAYRSRLAESIRPGSLVVGAHSAYLEFDKGKAEERFQRSYSRDGRFYYGGLSDGDPGPGWVARVDGLKKRGTVAVFRWHRAALDRYRWPVDEKPPVRVVFEVPVKDLLHVDAYHPGDWRQFFADPRTRVKYLQWAPVLLAAEEFKAGNLSVGEPPSRRRG